MIEKIENVIQKIFSNDLEKEFYNKHQPSKKKTKFVIVPGAPPDAGIFVLKPEEGGGFLDFANFLEFFFDKNLQKEILWDGPNPVGNSIKGYLAQLVEHLAYNEEASGSSPLIPNFFPFQKKT